MNASVEGLTKASHHIAETLYKAQAAAGGPGAGASGAAASGAATNGAGAKPQGDVVDAEFVDVDESKKPN